MGSAISTSASTTSSRLRRARERLLTHHIPAVLLLAAGQTIDAAKSGPRLLIAALFVTGPYTLAAGYALLGGWPRTHASIVPAPGW